MTYDCITISRGMFSLCLFVLSPSSVSFMVFYLLCGVSDVTDGFVARKLYTESEKGAMLDIAADLLFVAIYAVKTLPLLNIPFWIRI